MKQPTAAQIQNLDRAIRKEIKRIERSRKLLAEGQTPAGPLAMLGYAKWPRHGPSRSTDDWMRELRQ